MTKKHLQERIGANIKKARTTLGVTQQQLASLCDFEKSNMARLESGNTNPTIYTLYKISSALGIPLSDLIKVDQK